MIERSLLKSWFRPPRRELLLFSALTFFLLAGLTVMALRAVRSERFLYQSRLQDEVRITADLVASQVNFGLARLRERLRTALDRNGDDLRVALETLGEGLPGSVAATMAEGDDRAVWTPPDGLLYPPVLQAEVPDRHPGVFASGDELEFRWGEHEEAARLAADLAGEEDPFIRAEALVRLARNLCELGRIDEAVSVYRELEGIETRLASGYHAGMFALYARTARLDMADRTEEARQAVLLLLEGLYTGRWAVSFGTYRFFAGEAERFLEGAAESDLARLEAIRESHGDVLRASEAISYAWERRAGGERGGTPDRGLHELIMLEQTPYSVHWMREGDRLAAVAGPLDSLATWFTPDLLETLRERHTRLTVTDQEGRTVYGPAPASDRYHVPILPAETGLPWTLHLFRVDIDEGLADIRSREWGVVFALLLVALLVGISAWYMARAVSRELDVARLKSDFVSAVSHEFRTPLTSIRQLSELIAQERVSDEAQQKKYFEVMQRESDRLHRLVEDLLDFRRMEAGAKEFSMRPVDIAAMAAETCGLFSEQVEPLGYRIQQDIRVGEVPVWGDREALSRALWNLLDNAVKYSPEERKVRVRTNRSGEWVVLKVTDWGVGIPEEEHEQVFEPFVRGRSARLTSARGSGVGLSLVKHIVEVHEGTITVTSSPGEGTTFTIQLPIRRE